jgi:hypothetical protein
MKGGVATTIALFGGRNQLPTPINRKTPRMQGFPVAGL